MNAIKTVSQLFESAASCIPKIFNLITNYMKSKNLTLNFMKL